MRILWILVAVVASTACGGGTFHRVNLVNSTDRAIENVYVYPMGSADHGPSKGSIAAGGSLELKVKQGNVDVLAESAKVQIDETTRERRTASGTLELKHPMEIVFYDSSKPAPPDKDGVINVPFHVEEAAADDDAPASDAPAPTEPAPTAPAPTE